ncbi:polysaccharide biosynthesis tyrosine autokinase [Flammeovirga yaeyamensis]|uniref:non-specific protein-tyrosine kinase n=1 Tax=Flammeovirga yaeyamensis TaxID=367791 RepID=A0AAX1MZD0_9BACT|nr:polysaccharide biosynthesis tyrosine autokinase [Flammeovirga yaeyamensis]MBB3700947.1 capsular exopolysaccharide synthesis family protein [Flammeovirga yaeyamensis]NMF38054.1 polysaccharide biosynthesis tyrosine autokinase [Flammeovirga yaeyamensis]QWG00704.1 polysaccharide biosynthesis tyrosine autokinase [Flammeovirga yaeyamensis]
MENQIQQNQQQFQQDPEDKAIKDFKKWFYLCLENWKWIVLSIVLGLGISIAVSLYQTNRWEISAELVKKSTEGKGGASADFMSMLPIDAMGAEYSKINLEYEKRYFTSREVLMELVECMDLNIHYYDKKWIKSVELYKHRPYTLLYDKEKSTWGPFSGTLEVKEINQNQYQLLASEDTIEHYFLDKTFTFGIVANVNGFQFEIKKEDIPSTFFTSPYLQLNSILGEAKSIRRRLKFGILGEKNTDLPLIQMKIEGSIPNKEVDVLSKLVETIKNKDILDKNFATKQSAQFIQDQLRIISDSMQLIASEVYKLKTSNTELSGGAELVFEKIYKLDEKRNELELSIRYCDYLLQEMKGDQMDEEVLMPEAYGISGSQLTEMLSKYSELKLEDALSNQRLKKSILYQEEAVERQKALGSLQQKIAEAVVSTKKALKIQLDELNKELKKSIRSTNTLLSEEKTLSDYQRLFETHEQLYKLLLEKQAEYNIRAASTISDYTMMSVPEPSEIPIFPKRKLNVLIGFILGLSLPIGIMYVMVLFDTKVREEQDINDIVDQPFLGNIATLENPNELMNPLTRSVAAESYRNKRTNLQFLIGEKEKFSIVFTSSISGEGKSVTSANMAQFYTVLDKKVLLVGADLRKPVLDNFYPHLNKNLGMSNYLSSGNDIKEYIQKTDNEFLDVLLSGTIPPNPTELLQGKKMKELFDELQTLYDIIIYDSAPIGIVSDSRNLMRYADLVCFAVRQGYTPKAQLEKTILPVTQMQDVKLALFMTDVKMHKKGGYQYSYYGKDYISYLEK